MPPKKKPKRAKSGMKQKQRQTQIVTVNVGAPASASQAVRRRRRAKKSGSGTASGAPPPSRQQFVQTIYPTTNPLQQDTHFNLASIAAQLQNLQNIGGVSLGSVPTQQQIQLGAAPQDSSLDTTPVVRVGSPELPREAPLVIDVGTQARIKRKIKIVEDVGTDPMSDEDVSTRFKPISVPTEDTPFKPISVSLSDPAPVSRRADGEPEDTPYGSLKFELPPPKKRGAPKLTDIEKQERRERKELTRQESLTTPIIGEPINEPYAEIKSNPLGSVGLASGGGGSYATLVGATESSFRPTIARPSETASLIPKVVQPTIDTLFARQGETS